MAGQRCATAFVIGIGVEWEEIFPEWAGFRKLLHANEAEHFPDAFSVARGEPKCKNWHLIFVPHRQLGLPEFAN